MATTSITIRMDKNLKKQAETLFNEIGINMTTAFTIFTKTAVRQQRIPFELAADPFFSKENKARLRKAAKDMDAGNGTVHKTIAELEAMENG